MQFNPVRAAVVAVAVQILASCTTAPAAEQTAQVVATVLVKPRAVADAQAVLRAMQAPLGRDAGVRYVRPMAGDTHMVYLTDPAVPARVPELIERLRRSGSFEYVELDSMMKIQ